MGNIKNQKLSTTEREKLNESELLLKLKKILVIKNCDVKTYLYLNSLKFRIF